MKKRLITLLLVVVVIFSVSGEAWACTNGEWYIDPNFWPELSPWKSDGPYTHSRTVTYLLKCVTCGDWKLSTRPYETDPHTWGQWNDAGHIGLNRHRQVRYCFCGEMNAREYSCNGNPCWYPLYVPSPILELY